MTSAITSRDDTISELQTEVDNLRNTSQALKEALHAKASNAALREVQGNFASHEELKQVKTQGAQLLAQVEHAGTDVAAYSARVAALASHVDGNDEATSQAIKVHTARFQSDIDRVLRNVERVDSDRVSEMQALSGRIADVHAALQRKADCKQLERTAAAALDKDAFAMHMQAYLTRSDMLQRLEPLELTVTSVQAQLSGVRDTMAVSDPCNPLVLRAVAPRTSLSHCSLCKNLQRPFLKAELTLRSRRKRAQLCTLPWRLFHRPLRWTACAQK
jgi:DNA repair exonuclease SbcCD ATPase subunit